MIQISFAEAQAIVSALKEHLGADFLEQNYLVATPSLGKVIKSVRVIDAAVTKREKAYTAANLCYSAYLAENGDDDDLLDFLNEEMSALQDSLSDDAGNESPVDTLAFLMENVGTKKIVDEMTETFDLDLPFIE